jgi:uncharacterized protein YceK
MTRTPRARTPRSLARLALVAAAGALAGCSTVGDLLAPTAGTPGPVPSGLEQAEVLNIQVFRNVTDLELTNTTARSFGPGRLWINERYSREIDGLAIGESLDLPLSEFVDEFGDSFRAGGFFATRDPDPLVLAQLESEGVLYGLLLGGDRIK